MMQWLWKNKIHLLIWAVFGLYLLSATHLYVTYFVRNGKPLEDWTVLPKQTGNVISGVDDIRPVVYDGQDMYMVSGWVFSPDITESAGFTKKLVLHSVSRDFVFSSKDVLRKDLNKSLSQYSMNLEDAGFDLLIAKDVLPVDNYKIGFILEDQQGTVRVYQLTNNFIEREPNHLRFIRGD